MLPFSDSHCHLDFTQFDPDRPALLKACQSEGVRRILVPGTAWDAFEKQINLCQQHPMLDMALGFHPLFIQHFQAQHLEQLQTNLQTLPVVAVGEIGLDFTHWVEQSKQITLFRQQLELAEERRLPVILHQRKSHNELIRQLKLSGFSQGGVLHAFSGSLQQAEDYIQLGFKLGIGGTISYNRANKTRKTLRSLALEHLLLETDAPDMPLHGYQGQRNSPLQIPTIAQHLSDIKQISLEEVSSQIEFNYEALFAHG